MGIESENSLDALKQDLFEYVQYQLGGQIVDHIILTVVVVGHRAVDAMRQRSDSGYKRTGIIDGRVACSGRSCQRILHGNDGITRLLSV